MTDCLREGFEFPSVFISIEYLFMLSCTECSAPHAVVPRVAQVAKKAVIMEKERMKVNRTNRMVE